MGRNAHRTRLTTQARRRRDCTTGPRRELLYLKIYPLRRDAILLLRERVRDDDLQDVLAGRQVRPQLQATEGDEPLRVCLSAQVHDLACERHTVVAEEPDLRLKLWAACLFVEARVVDLVAVLDERAG